MRAAADRIAPAARAGYELRVASDSVAAAPIVRGILRSGDVLLVKGSLGMAMDRVITGLSAR